MESPKYNRTFHFPFSPGATSDDKIADSMVSLVGVEIVITEKMDGSNTSLESSGCFARTHSGPPTHPSFAGLKALHAKIGYEIPLGAQLFGEWCFAKHSISYEALPGYFLLFGIRELDSNDVDNSIWCDWKEVEFYAHYFELPTVPVLFKGVVNSEKELQDLIESFMIQPSCCGGIREGVVCRVTRQFLDNEFPRCVMKCVRADHVQTSDHWKDQEIVKNKLV